MNRFQHLHLSFSVYSGTFFSNNDLQIIILVDNIQSIDISHEFFHIKRLLWQKKKNKDEKNNEIVIIVTRHESKPNIKSQCIDKSFCLFSDHWFHQNWKTNHFSKSERHRLNVISSCYLYTCNLFSLMD